MPRKHICPACEKEFEEKDRKITYVKITNEGGFDTVRIIRTCSWTCKAAYEERVLQNLKESERFRIMR